MKPNRFLKVTIVFTILVLSTVFLLSSCASTGGRKKAEPEQGATSQAEKSGTPIGQQSTSGSVGRSKPAGGADTAVAKSSGRAAESNTAGELFQHGSAYLKEALERIFPEGMPALNWNRIGTVMAGIASMLLIYGLAFWLGRRPLRRRRIAGAQGN